MATMHPASMPRVVVESPYAGNIALNEAYARACLADCLERGEAPVASHLLYTQPGVLRDNDPDERALGIAAGHQWIDGASLVIVYVDFGISSGMKAGIAEALRVGTQIEPRTLPPEIVNTLTTKHGHPDP